MHYGPLSYHRLGRIYPRRRLREPMPTTLIRYFGGSAQQSLGFAAAPLLLTVADNQNNTGATATITGSDVGSTNKIYVVSIKNIFNSAVTQWYQVATRVGDGTVNLPLPYDTYWGFVLGTVNGLMTESVPTIFPVTLNPLSVYSRILLDVTARLQSLNLPGIGAQQVFRGMFPSDRTSVFPCVWVTKEGLRETQLGGTNIRDDWGYPVNVVFVDRNPQTYEAPSQTYDLWRSMIRRAFEKSRLPNVPEVYDCDVEPGVIVDPKLPHFAYLVSGMVLRFKSRETRGTS